MKKRVIKLSEEQVRQIIAEDFPFNYPDDSNAPHNHNSQVFVNAPFDSPNVDPENTTGDDVSHTLSNNSWWNRHYGFNGYCV